jgi:radical SAM protein with 4Fe4S-binding SPASM domain
MGFWRTKELTFILGNTCNLNCIYCYPGEYKYGNLRLDFDFAKRGVVDFLVKERLGSLDKIRYFGIGEPTVEFDLMKQVHSYVTARVVEQENKPIRSEIQTNGVFSEEVARWIGENLDVICISCDGFPHIQNKQRPLIDGASTSSIIERNVRILTQYDIDVGMRPTITGSSVGTEVMKRIVEYGKEVGFSYIYFHPMIPSQGPSIRRNDGEPYAIDPVRFAKNYVEAWKYAQDLGIFVGNHLTINFDEEVEVYCRSCLPTPQLMVDGYVSCCDEALYGGPKYGGERFEKLIIGKYDRERDEIDLFWDRIKAIREKRNVHNMEVCKDCEIATNCAGGCLGEALFSRGDPFVKLSDRYCEAVKYLARYIPRNQGLFRYMHP